MRLRGHRGPIRGRGTFENPPNRFDRIDYEPDPETLEPVPGEEDEPDRPRTELYRDASRSILAKNDSPDVPFERSLNPYRGCEHGCVYCLAPETPVLRAGGGSVPIGDLRAGDRLLAFDERPGADGARRYREAVVEAVWWSRKPTVRIVTSAGEVRTTAEHRWLDARGRWLRTDELAVGMAICRVALGGGRAEAGRAGHAAAGGGVWLYAGAPAAGLAAEREADRFRRGSGAGLLVAAGAVVAGGARSLDAAVLERARGSGVSPGPRFDIERGGGSVGSDGPPADPRRLLAACSPAPVPWAAPLPGTVMGEEAAVIEAIEPGPAADVVDVQTSTATFFAAGLASHNCFARPTHETLGFSSGLDFETKLVVKEDAPELLRAELSSPRWRPQVVAISGVTDPYQPIERRLRLTRRCLEVFAEFRNPVAIVTKNRLVTRDADLLGELARHDAAAVFVSVTTLDPGLQRILEPRASAPAKRLEAIRELTDAGIPVGVLVAPVIPALTDHEMPGILIAAAAAGARSAGYVPLRLPFALKELFESWLEAHFPDRKEKVLNRLRSLRDGRLNDPDFGTRMRGSGPFADEMRSLFQIACRKAGLGERDFALSTAAFRGKEPAQRSLFG